LWGLFEKVWEKGWEIELRFVVGFLAFFEGFGRAKLWMRLFVSVG
jgi:hypothetical protein